MDGIDGVPPGGLAPPVNVPAGEGPAAETPAVSAGPQPEPPATPPSDPALPSEGRRGDSRLDGQVRRLQVEGQLGQPIPPAGGFLADVPRLESLSDHDLEILALGRNEGDRRQLTAIEQGIQEGGVTRSERSQLHRLEQAREAASARGAILDHMISGCEPPMAETQRQKILQAMDGFSLDQIRRMGAAGVRIWNDPRSLPPEFARLGHEVGPLNHVAQYEPDYRVIRTSPDRLDRGSATNDFRHELAHAWDDVRNEARPRNMASLPEADRERVISQRHAALNEGQFESMSSRRLAPSNLSMDEMLERFQARAPRNELTFAHPSTDESIPKRNPVEFFAEGYSVFHGNDQNAQARLLHYAPELYEHLARESTQMGLPVPDREALVALTRERGFH